MIGELLKNAAELLKRHLPFWLVLVNHTLGFQELPEQGFKKLKDGNTIILNLTNTLVLQEQSID